MSEDGRDFVTAPEGGGEPPARFVAWGVNYDHDAEGRLIEDYWHDEWGAVESDFREIAALGANTVRVHLQLARFMRSPVEPDPANLRKLAELVDLAERTRLYLDVTGLGCYHKADVPDWYDVLSEQDRWDVQARFWTAVAEVCRDRPAVFCYDLMNEPVVGGGGGEGEGGEGWLAGEFGDKHFVQRIALELGGRSREEVARLWVEKLTGAIRRVDPDTLVTVGIIPWAYPFKGAKPLFYSAEAGAPLDFASVHFYPEGGDVDGALEALRVYDVGKPLVVEEFFPLRCAQDEMLEFVARSREICDGYLSFYWGKPAAEYRRGNSLQDALVGAWLEAFAAEGRRLREARLPDPIPSSNP